MNFLKKNKIYLLLIFLLLVLYFLLRLPNLTLQPIFADEAIYIRWAQVMRSEPTLRFLPLSDGKTPLFMWVMMPVFKIFSDPLLAGRILSVFAGLGTLFGALFLGWKFFKPSVGIWAAFLITITPYIVFFDRMALVDSMLAAFVIWSLNLSLWLVQKNRLDLAMILGYTLGGGLLTKTPGMFSIMVLPVTLITFDWFSKKRSWNLVKLVALWIVAIGIAMVMYNALRLGPGFDSLSSRNQDYIFGPERLISSPLDPLIPHFHDMADWFPKMITVPILIAAVGGIILAFVRRNKFAIAVALWSLVPLLVEMALLRTFTARYLLFTIPPLLCLGGWFIQYLMEVLKGEKKLIYFTIKYPAGFKGIIPSLLIILILLSQALYFDYLLITNPFIAPLPREEKIGYFEEWTAGYGFPEIAKFLEEEAKKGRVVIGTEGAFGTLPDGLYIYLDKVPNISVVPGKATISAELKRSAFNQPTYFVGNKNRLENGLSGAKLLKEFPKATSDGRKQNAILLYQVEQDPHFKDFEK